MISALYLTEQNKVIENNTGLADLKIIYKNSVVDSLYSTKLLLKNSGKKAITKDFVFEPFIAKIQRSKRNFTIEVKLLNQLDSKTT